jgi:hypothetical protein
MASIRKEIVMDVSADRVWAAFQDVSEVHRRVAPGFVTDCRMDGADRIVTFSNGFVAREVIVDINEKEMRLVYSARSERLAHHNASFQVIDEGKGQDGRGRCRVVWIADVLPHEAAKVVGAMMEEGAAVMRKTLESHSTAA